VNRRSIGLSCPAVSPGTTFFVRVALQVMLG
jgi:hypothetical protein